MKNEKDALLAFLSDPSAVSLILGKSDEALSVVDFVESRIAGLYRFRTANLPALSYSTLFFELYLEGYIGKTEEGFSVDISYRFGIRGGGENGIKIGYFFLRPDGGLFSYRREGENPVTLSTISGKD